MRNKKAIIRCSKCGFRLEWCICGEIKKINNSADIVLIAHILDEQKPSNTGKIISACLENCEVIKYGAIGEVFDINSFANKNTLILYPTEESKEITKELYESLSKPSITILDGTWSQAAKMANKFKKAGGKFIHLPKGIYDKYMLRKSNKEERLCSAQALIQTLKILGENTLEFENALKLFIEKNLKIRGRINT